MQAPRTPPLRPNHPLATGLIIAASVLVAAGIALYESPQVRQWVDQSRRKIAVALHSLGDDIQPRRPSESSQDYEGRKNRRDELIRRNRNELIRRAREEGIAVDLDELAKIGTEDIQAAERRTRADRSKSFDDMVGSDGMLRRDAKTTGNDSAEGSVRKRGGAGFPVDSISVAARTNPFSDNQLILDLNDDEAPSPKPFTYVEPGTRESSATLIRDSASPPAAPELLIDLTSNSVQLQPGSEGLGSLTHLETSDTDQAAQSFYSFTSSDSRAEDLTTSHHFFDDHEAEHVSTGTLTPRSERSMATGASVIDSQADDIAILSMQNSLHNESDHDARSEIFSEGGFTDAAFSDAGFSDAGNVERPDRLGIMTPSSWTDVGSDDDSEWGGVTGNGHVSQMHQ